MLEFRGLGAARGPLSLATTEAELQDRWRSHAKAMKAMMETGVEGQGRRAATSSSVSLAAFEVLFRASAPSPGAVVRPPADAEP